MFAGGALRDPDDAADAFQATFLVLVRKAGSVRVEDSLGRWLYGVSRRVAAGRGPRETDARAGNEESLKVRLSLWWWTGIRMPNAGNCSR